MSRSALLAALLLVSVPVLAGEPAAGGKAALVEHGRYVVMIGGCNDCHTAGFAQAGGKLPESAWLLGDSLGWSGPWGTTYAPNLRLRIAGMDADAFKAYARGLVTRPPMPYWAVNAMSDRDLEAMHAFITTLGPAGELAPAALPPGVVARGPVVQFPAPPPALATR